MIRQHPTDTTICASASRQLAKAMRRENEALRELWAASKRIATCDAALSAHRTAVFGVQMQRAYEERVKQDEQLGLEVAGKLRELQRALERIHERQETGEVEARLRRKCGMLSEEVERLKEVAAVSTGLRSELAEARAECMAKQGELMVLKASFEVLRRQTDTVVAYGRAPSPVGGFPASEISTFAVSASTLPAPKDAHIVAAAAEYEKLKLNLEAAKRDANQLRASASAEKRTLETALRERDMQLQQLRSELSVASATVERHGVCDGKINALREELQRRYAHERLIECKYRALVEEYGRS